MKARKREEALKSELLEVRFTAGLADQRNEELSSYIRRNNLRIYGVIEGDNNGSRGGEETECLTDQIFACGEMIHLDNSSNRQQDKRFRPQEREGRSPATVH